MLDLKELLENAFCDSSCSNRTIRYVKDYVAQRYAEMDFDLSQSCLINKEKLAELIDDVDPGFILNDLSK
jgi:hypothetical protein